MKITRYDQIQQEYVKAHIDVYIEKWGMHLRDLRLIKSRNGHMFISFPSKRVGEGDSGQWVPYVDFDADTKERFQSSIMKAIDEYAKEVATQSESSHAAHYDAPPF